MKAKKAPRPKKPELSPERERLNDLNRYSALISSHLRQKEDLAKIIAKKLTVDEKTTHILNINELGEDTEYDEAVPKTIFVAADTKTANATVSFLIEYYDQQIKEIEEKIRNFRL